MRRYWPKLLFNAMLDRRNPNRSVPIQRLDYTKAVAIQNLQDAANHP